MSDISVISSSINEPLAREDSSITDGVSSDEYTSEGSQSDTEFHYSHGRSLAPSSSSSSDSYEEDNSDGEELSEFRHPYAKVCKHMVKLSPYRITPHELKAFTRKEPALIGLSSISDPCFSGAIDAPKMGDENSSDKSDSIKSQNDVRREILNEVKQMLPTNYVACARIGKPRDLGCSSLHGRQIRNMDIAHIIPTKSSSNKTSKHVINYDSDDGYSEMMYPSMSEDSLHAYVYKNHQ